MLPGASQRRTLTIICVAFTAVILLLHFTNAQYDQLDETGRDWLLTNSKARRATRDDRIVFLAIDEATRQLDTLFDDEIQKSPALQLMKQPFPWNRALYGQIIERLVGAGAKVVVFDMVFPGARDGDDEFSAALEKYRDRVVIGSNLVSKGQEDVDGSIYSGANLYVPPSKSLIPQPKNDPRVGFVVIHEDADNIVRRVHYRTTPGEFFRGVVSGDELFSLAARALQQAGLADHVPADHGARVFRYAEDFQPRSLFEIFVENQWNAPPYRGGVFFRDKIVVIGSLGHSSEDRVQSPFGITQGPFIHLNAINAALHDDFIRRTPTSANISSILVAGALAWILGAYIRRPILRLVLLVLIGGLFIQSAQWLADSGLLTLLISPLLALATSGLVWATWEQVLDRVERQRVRRNFERYVSKDVVGEILDNPQTYLDTLGGQRKEVTILFSDIRGFTTLTESADPHALVEQLNEYFGEMVGLVFSNHGTVDKFIGDAVMAHWGSITTAGPTTDAIRAVTTALKMRESLVRLNASWKERGMLEWKFGIGVNFGRPIAGNIGAAGSVEKFDFTVIGDAVNLASRLEGATKQYGIDMCIGEGVAAMVGDQFLLRSVDLIIVKGKTQPVEIFTVLGQRDKTTAPPWLAKHEEAMRLYRTGEFATAEKIWREIVTEVPGDALSKVFIWRCIALQASPPEPPWTGVYAMKSK